MRRMAVMGICIFLFSAMVFSGSSVPADESMLMLLVPNPYTIEKSGGYDKIVMEGFYTRGLPGAPKLPQKTYDVQLPSYAILETVRIEILSKSTKIIEGEYEIGPGPFPYSDESPPIIPPDGKDPSIYGKNEFYPIAPVELLRTYQARDKKIVVIQFTPLQYNPVSKILQLNEEVEIRISWNRGAPIMMAAPPITWSGYAIITTNAIVSGSSNLSNFITYLQNRNFTVTTVTETQYGAATGQQRAINIRNWLINNYNSLQLQYVLLIGDPDPDDPGNPVDTFGDVPMMMCWPDANVPPTDYFYADLTGNWDSDGDGHYGEYGEDNVDFGPEVYVGRIPVYGADYATLDAILNKIINYDGANHSIMLPVAISNYQDEHQASSCADGDARTDGLNLPERVITNITNPQGYTDYVMYERSGFTGRGNDPVPTTAYGYDAPLTRANVINQWANDYGIVFWWGHGSQTDVFRKYWGDAADDGDNIVEDGFCGSAGDELSWPTFLSSSDTSTLADTETFTYQSSCQNGWPENSNNLQYALLIRGAIATVSATRNSLYAIGTWENGNWTDNTGIGYTYINHLVTNGEAAGKALYDGKNSLTIIWGAGGWRNLFDFNLYGDPSLTLQAPVLRAILSSSISVVPNLASSGQQVTVTMNVANSGGTQANNVAPSALTMNTTGTASATYLSGPTPASANISAGSSQDYTWTYIANSGLNGGTISFTGNATGTDAGTGDPVSSPVSTSNIVTVQVPASINASLTTNLTVVSGGQNFAVNMVVSNTGQATANNVTPSALSTSTTGTASTAYVSGPAPGSSNIAGGSSVTFSWIYTANSGANGGTVTFSGNASGTDANSGNTIVSNTPSATVTVQTPANLISSLVASPVAVKPGDPITVVMTVQNTGQAGALNVTPSALTVAGGGAVTFLSGPAPPSVNIPGLSSQIFTWTYKAAGVGIVTFSGNAAGIDANSGLVVTSPLTTSNIVTIKNLPSPHANPQMRPVSQAHISQAKDLLTQANDLLSQAKATNLDTAQCEKLIDEAKLDLAEARTRVTSPITANYYALRTIERLKQAIDCLKALLG